MNRIKLTASHSTIRSSQGFTLIELMAVIAVLAIVAAIAIPNMRDGINSSRARGQAKDIIGDLQFARAESLGRGNNVAICASTNTTSCGGVWADGWIVFVDNGATAGTVDAGEEVLRIHEGLDNSLLTVMSGAATPVALPFIRFDRRGGSVRTTVLVCADGADEKFARAVLIENSGRVTLSRRGGSDIHVDINGNDVVC